MKKEPDNETIAQLFVDLKSRKPRKSEDWISVAKKVKEVVEWKGSASEAAKIFEVAPYLVRSIVSLLDLPKEVQNMVKEGRLGQDTASKLNGISDSRRQIEVARKIEGLPQWQQRSVIGYVRRLPDANLDQLVKRLAAEEKRERVHVAAVILSEEDFLKVDGVRKRRNVTLEALLTEVIRKWIDSGMK
jgi:hypothetical protein